MASQKKKGPNVPSPAKKRPTTVRFFRMFIDGRQPPQAVLDTRVLHGKLEALKFDADVPNTRYYKSGDGDEFVGKSTLLPSGILRLRMAKKTPAPHYELAGVFKVAPSPGQNARWIAPTYCAFFPGNNIVGAIFSSEGPRMYQVCQYLEAARFGANLAAHELARPNVRAELERLVSINRFVVRYRASQTPSLFAAERADIHSVMKSYADLNEDAEITVSVKSKMKGGGALRGVKQIIANALADDMPNFDVEKFVVYGPDKFSTKKKSRPVDLLLSKIRATVDVEVEEQGTQLVEEDAFRAIEGSYAEHLTQFPSLTVDGDSTA